MNKRSRPVYLNLLQFSFPLPAIASITHRVTGALLFVAMALFLYLVQMALESDAGFAAAGELLADPLVKLVTWAALAALIYHLVAGIRHLLMDFQIGDTLQGGRRGTHITLLVSALLVVLAGLWLW